MRHLALNHVAGIVHPLQVAIGEEPGARAFCLSSTAGEGRLAAASEAMAHQRISVQVETLDRFCANRSLAPDFIKIDVEGFELAVLRGARRVVAERGRALRLFVELHPSIWPIIGVTRAEFLAELEVLRLDMVPLDPFDDPWSCEGICVRLRPR